MAAGCRPTGSRNISSTPPTRTNATFSRLILQYNNNTQNNHTVGWIGFDPNATGAARNYLYIGAADASYGNNYGKAISPERAAFAESGGRAGKDSCAWTFRAGMIIRLIL